jgi:predicted O-methyltransferase YrrM
MTIAGRQVEALSLAEGFMEAQVLFTLNELGVFDRLAESARTADDLAGEIGAQRDPLERLLNAGVALGLLRLGGPAYSNSEAAGSVLVSGAPGYLGDWMRWMGRLAGRFQRLAHSVRTGEPADDPMLHLGGDPEFTRDFIMGMHDYAQVRGSEVTSYVDLGGVERLIDVGGGPGTYAIEFARKWPQLHVTVFDLPSVVGFADANIRAAGLQDRVTTVAGNYLADDLGHGYDAALLSDVLHQEDADMALEVLRRVHGAIRAGGRLVVQGMFLNEDRVSPRWPTLASLIMLVSYGAGRIYTVEETMRMVEEAGFRSPRFEPMSLGNVNSLVLAGRP